MAEREFTVEEVLILLAQTPERIAALTAGLTEDQLHTATGPGEWPANDVLAHLRACADVWGKYIAAMLAEDRPTIRAISPRTWVKKTNYPELQFGKSLRSFTSQRADLLALLEPLPHEAWSRGATVIRPGKTLERTVFSYAQALVVHEQPHIEQIECIGQTLHK